MDTSGGYGRRNVDRLRVPDLQIARSSPGTASGPVQGETATCVSRGGRQPAGGIYSPLVTVFEWVETTRVAHAVRDSLMLTASLSAIHLLGFTLITGAALLTNLRFIGVLLTKQPLNDVTRPATRGIAVGLAISVITGGLLFSTRAVAAAENRIFHLKMSLLVAAAIFHFAVQRRMAIAGHQRGMVRASGVLGLGMWLGLALAGCAFILLE
jgi:hypothetical protein